MWKRGTSKAGAWLGSRLGARSALRGGRRRRLGVAGAGAGVRRRSQLGAGRGFGSTPALGAAFPPCLLIARGPEEGRGPGFWPSARPLNLAQVPYVGASARQVEHVLSLLRGRSGKMVDLGSGDGRIVRRVCP